MIPVPLLVAVEVGIVVGVVHTVVRMSGWPRLAQEYGASMPFEGQIVARSEYATLSGWVGYNGCLVVGASADGLYLSVWPIFRLGNPPLFIPWSDVAVARIPGRAGRTIELRFQRTSSVPVAIRPELADKLAAASQGRFKAP